MKKYLSGLCVGITILLVSACVHCSSPNKDTCFLIGTPNGVHGVCFEKGEFDRSEEERGYKVFDSLEEVGEYYMSLRSRKPGGIFN